MDAALHTIDLTISFIDHRFRFPDGQTLWTRLTRAADRGVTVRLLAWSNPGFMSQRKLFATNRPALDPRWQLVEHPSPTSTHCHHEKIWVIDAGEPTTSAFVAGVVLTRLDLVERRLAGLPEGRFDAGLHVRGPVTDDVADVFEIRWRAAGGLARSLSPAAVSPGETRAQLGRTEMPGLLRPAGLTTIHEQYQHAIDADRHQIMLVNQHPGELDLLQRLEKALQRGVGVLLIVPAAPMPAIGQARRTQHPRYAATFEALSALAQYPNFEMAAPFEGDDPIYVHAKLGLFDDGFLTCGSANLVDLSMAADHTETNLHVWSTAVTSAMRVGVEKLALRPLDPRTYAL